MNPKTAMAAELIKAAIIQPPKLPPLLSPVRPATNDATNGETMNPMLKINEASKIPEEILKNILFTTVPGIIIIGSKNITIMYNGSLLISLKRLFKVPSIVPAIITNRKFKPMKASKLKPSALPNPTLINYFLQLYFQFKKTMYKIDCKSYLNLFKSNF